MSILDLLIRHRDTFPATIVAEQVLWERRELPTTPLLLIKLVFLCHAWHLAKLRAPLIMERVEAWKYGPVVPSVYHQYKRFGADPISEAHTDNPDFDKHQRLLIRNVVDFYKVYSTNEIMIRTHEPGSPWHTVYHGGRPNAEIPDELIQHYYESLS